MASLPHSGHYPVLPTKARLIDMDTLNKSEMRNDHILAKNYYIGSVIRIDGGSVHMTTMTMTTQ